MTDFERNIEDHNLPVIIDFSYDNCPLLIAFGGMIGAIGMPPFEFFSLTKNLEINKVYLRDLNQAWYHSGLHGISTNIVETASYLRQKIDESGARKVVVVGNSMGGFAAILFGILINADVVHAFSAHTSLKDASFIRSKKQLHQVHNRFQDDFFDLKEVIQSHNISGKINLYYNSKDKIDRKHAANLECCQNITLHPFNGYGHGLIKNLKISGDLRDIITSSLHGVPVGKFTVDKQKHSIVAKIVAAFMMNVNNNSRLYCIKNRIRRLLGFFL